MSNYLKNLTGFQGIPGNQGNVGAQGNQGIQGPVGPVGSVKPFVLDLSDKQKVMYSLKNFNYDVKNKILNIGYHNRLIGGGYHIHIMIENYHNDLLKLGVVFDSVRYVEIKPNISDWEVKKLNSTLPTKCEGILHLVDLQDKVDFTALSSPENYKYIHVNDWFEYLRRDFDNVFPYYKKFFLDWDGYFNMGCDDVNEYLVINTKRDFYISDYDMKNIIDIIKNKEYPYELNGFKNLKLIGDALYGEE